MVTLLVFIGSHWFEDRVSSEFDPLEHSRPYLALGCTPSKIVIEGWVDGRTQNRQTQALGSKGQVACVGWVISLSAHWNKNEIQSSG